MSSEYRDCADQLCDTEGDSSSSLKQHSLYSSIRSPAHHPHLGKFALRATGQSLAREFGPQGVHIAHAIIDGVIDILRTKEWPANGGVPDGKISSDAVS